jgi:hypothetical protein
MPRRPALMLAYDNAVQRTLRAAREAIDMVVVPGTVATYTQHGTSCFLKSLDRPYLIDPRTPVFQFTTGMRLRPAEQALARAHGEAFVECLAGGHLGDEPSDEDWLLAATTMARHQRDYGLSCEWGRPPTTIVAPYLMADSSQDKAWDLSLAMLAEAQAAVPGHPVTAVAALESPTPSEPDLGALGVMLTDLGRIQKVTTVLMWLDDLDEHALSPATVTKLAGLVASRRVPALFNLYGGYLSLLLNHFGLAGVSSGVGYGHLRGVRRQAPSDVPPPGYYLPLVHAVVRPRVAEDFIQRIGREAQCPCDICQELVGGVAVARLTPARLRLHFANARAAERSNVANRSLDELVKELLEVEREIDEAVRIAPDLADIHEISYRHLGAWARGLSAAGSVFPKK